MPSDACVALSRKVPDSAVVMSGERRHKQGDEMESSTTSPLVPGNNRPQTADAFATKRNLDDRIQDTRITLGLHIDVAMQMLKEDAHLSDAKATFVVKSWIDRYWADKERA
jgi:hypothetical protein